MSSGGTLLTLVGVDAPAAEPRLRRRVSETDLFLFVAVALVQLVASPLAAHHQHHAVRALDEGGWALLAAGALVVLGRHRAPVAALAGAFVITATYVGIGYPGGPIWLPLIVTLAQCFVTGHRRAAVSALIVGYVTFLWLRWAVGDADPPTLAEQLGLGAWLITLGAVVELVRTRRERAVEQARRDLERLQLQATDERLRIARELHDAVAHSMSLINVQAGVALHLIDERPEQAREALATIKGASKDALVELRSILGVLRQVDEDVPRGPTPSLGRIDELVHQASLSGVDVHLEVHGDLAHLPRPVDLAAYRIVQESLTNVVRHAGRPDATVRIRAGDGLLAVEVLDEGLGPAASGVDLPSGGNGIAGMRERASSVGGNLEAGPRAGRGFAVRAQLPLGGDG
jgi:signal transduction histidine kinase